jgi:hypothetical protein
MLLCWEDEEGGLVSRTEGDADFTVMDLKVYIIYIIRLNNHGTNMAQRGPTRRAVKETSCFTPVAEKKRVGHAVRPPSKHYSSKGKEELSPFLFLSMKAS